MDACRTFKESLQHVRERFDQRLEEKDRLATPLRQLVRKTKESIYHAQAGREAHAAAYLQEAREAYERLVEKARIFLPTIPGPLHTPAMELVEAHATLVYAREERLITREESLVDDDEAYLLGLLDATGEIMRMAIRHAEEKPAFLLRARDWLECLYDELTLFSLPNGELRRKYDALKYTVRKLEDMAFQLLVQGRIAADEKASD